MATTVSTTNRMMFVMQHKDRVGLWPEGGGVNLRTWSLDFLYTEHRMHRNSWSKSNDGYDLVLYLGTKIYLPPLVQYSYAFWWDTDVGTITEPDFYRLHPAYLLGQQHVKFVRSQVPGYNHRTQKVWIKPPAQMTNQWLFAKDMHNWTLFAWGVTFINWAEPYFRTQSYQLPIYDLPANETYYKQGHMWAPVASLPAPYNKLVYSPMVDKGDGNLLTIAFLKQEATKPTNEDGRPILHTADMPYWLSTFGQDFAYRFGMTPKMDGQTDTGPIPWVYFIMPHWTSDYIQGTKTDFPPVRTFAFKSPNLKIMAKSGYFIQSDLSTRISLPILYKSYFKWGGTMMVKQKITQVFAPSNQVSVKDPGTVGTYVIKPRDLRHGILTEEALQRFLRKGSPSDERRPVPWQEFTAGDASSESYDETGSEAEESEEEPEKELDLQAAVRHLTGRIQRERDQRHRLNNFLRSLLTKKE